MKPAKRSPTSLAPRAVPDPSSTPQEGPELLAVIRSSRREIVVVKGNRNVADESSAGLSQVVSGNEMDAAQALGYASELDEVSACSAYVASRTRTR